LLLEPTQTLKRVLGRVDPFLKDDLLCSVLEPFGGKLSPMRERPVSASAVNPTVPEQEEKQLLAFAPKIVSRRLAGPHKIAHRLMSRVWRPNPCQLAGPMQSRQRDRVAPVRLDALARPFWDQAGATTMQSVAEGVNLAVKPVSRRPGFKADVQTVVPVRQSLDRPLDRKRTVSTSPRNRTSPVRPPSAIATACFFFATSNATKDSSYCPMVRPPRMRLGSACPSNPRSYLHERAAHRLSPQT
jgi:hypothetical protein